jgi:hypothetical protein
LNIPCHGSERLVLEMSADVLLFYNRHLRSSLRQAKCSY